MRKRKNERTEKLNRRFERDDEGRVIVNMTVNDDSSFLSTFSENNTPVISGDVAEFIEHITNAVPVTEPLTLRIHSNCIDEQEQVLYQAAVKEYYSGIQIANGRELKRNNIIVLLLTMAGILVLALKIWLECRTSSVIGAEVIDIAAWVFLWEAVDVSAFQNRALRFKRRRYLSYLSMKIEYVPAAEEPGGCHSV